MAIYYYYYIYNFIFRKPPRANVPMDFRDHNKLHCLLYTCSYVLWYLTRCLPKNSIICLQYDYNLYRLYS